MILILLIFSFVISTFEYKILVFNLLFAKSHVNYMNNLGDLLQEGGHNVTILRVPMNPDVEGSRTKIANEIESKYRNKEIDEKAKIMKIVEKGSWISRNSENPFNFAFELYEVTKWGTKACEFTINNSELMEELINEKFDLGIVEAFFPCGLGVLKHINITKHISVMSGALFDPFYSRFGLSFYTMQIPSIASPFTPQMSYKERFYNFFAYITLEITYYNHISAGNNMFSKYTKTSNIDLDKELISSAFFVSNDDPIVSYSTPQCPKILRLGGLLIGKPKPLNNEFDKLLNIREKNVIISFGSIAKSCLMTDEMKLGMVKIFKSFPNITFIWKYEEDRPDILNGIENVVTSKWIPQVDLLNDPRVSLFVTHGGMNTLNEVAYFGVPVLTIPLFGDQPRNAKMYEFAQIGKSIDKKDLVENNDLIISLFKELLEDPKYKENAIKISTYIKNRPYDLKEVFLKHIDFAAKFGNVQQLGVYNENMPFWKYLMLDVIAGIILIIILSISVLYRMFCTMKFMFTYAKAHEKVE
ncbi:UDP-glucuronosyl/UDP-glucosyltransferase family-containing protein [Strongyloides ratti]|uniref:glucuronosyltransferase n=1 Tax=Strongyloides ratti TaxID=34506 RepID=A0A090KR54_STRRB|nr:UDP-glucuronosyl/UDP-glucosyltransferase family-containing protein [Strongyloides ratti]CEF60004.1 UDP-glucuronosyl/UDP-glucosyltransferase family-containing protein [Strongyloides ratti]